MACRELPLPESCDQPAGCDPQQQAYERFQAVRLAADEALLKRFVFVVQGAPGTPSMHCHTPGLFSELRRWKVRKRAGDSRRRGRPQILAD